MVAVSVRMSAVLMSRMLMAPVPMVVLITRGVAVRRTTGSTGFPRCVHVLMACCDGNVEQVQRHRKQRDQSAEARKHWEN